MIEYGINTLGKGAQIFEPVTLGFPSRDNLDKTGFKGTTIGNHAIIRSGTILYCDVCIGDNFSCGHNVLIREKTRIGNRVAVGTACIIEGGVTIGNDVNLQSLVYIPTNTTIKDRVFIGPGTVLTNDRYPPSRIGVLAGPTILEGAAIGANVTILPGVRIGENSLVAAGAIVTRDVPPRKLAIGSPARIR
ncbi:MAG: N-acetyltransferase, partial [Methanoregulaceae archaeon]|nr:N-acetyltransferase [Methanoregulaceae archaeon]